MSRAPKVILVGVGDPDASADAVSLGAALADRLGGELILAASLGNGALGVDRDRGEQHRREHLDHIFAGATAVLGDFPHRRFELEGPAPQALGELAERAGASMLVLGRTHHGQLGRLYPGTVADRLLPRASRPVLIAPHGYCERPHSGFDTVGVGYDGGREAQGALGLAATLAGELRSSLELITVCPVLAGVDDFLADARAVTYRERLAAAARRFEKGAVAATFEQGDPARVLARRSAELDLLVVGTHARGPLLRSALGSVGSELIREAACPVLVVPRSQHRGEGETEAYAAAGADP